MSRSPRLVHRSAHGALPAGLAAALTTGLLAACGGDNPVKPPDNGGPSTVVLAAGAAQAFASGQGTTLTIPANSGAGDYTLVVSQPSGEDRPAALTVTGRGLAVGPVANRTPGEDGSASRVTPGALGAELGAELGAGALPVTDVPVMRRLRGYSSRELAPRLAALHARTDAGSGRLASSGLRTSAGTVLAVPNVGDLVQVNVRTDSTGGVSPACGSPIYRNARVAAVTDRTVVLDDTANPAGGFSDADYQQFGAAFDSLAYPVDVRNFGAPTDIDNNGGRVVVLFTRAVNELTPRAAPYVIGGFFWDRDLFPKTGSGACAGSNVAEMFYMLVPDPTGSVNGNARTKSYVSGATIGTLGHEFQHLISASRRLYVQKQSNYQEDVWLGEGLSHVAEELLFYRAAGLTPPGATPGQSPRARLTVSQLNTTQRDAFNAYAVQNFARFRTYLGGTDTTSAFANNDELAARGATWAFLRYAADRLPGPDSTFFYRLVNGSATGLANLQAALGSNVSLDDWVRDWAVANYADGLAGTSLDAPFTYRSWVMRNVVPALSGRGTGTYPIATRTLSDGTPASVVGRRGGVTYFRLSTGGTSDVKIETRTAAGTVPASGVRFALVRTR